MNDQRNKKGYESEDGIGVVYDVSSRSNCTSTVYTLLMIISVLVFTALISFGAGFWFGEDQILKQYLFNLNPAGQEPEIPMISELTPDGSNQKPDTPPSKGGIFPPPMNVFGAGNGQNPVGLTEEEKKRMEEAEALCDAKKCCREDDDVETDSSACPDMGYLECLAADNACVWDCTQGHQGEDDLHYNREFKGIDRHDAEKIDRPRATEEEEDATKNKVDPNLVIDTVDECGTMYEYYLKEQDRIREAERVQNNPNTHQEGDGGDVELGEGDRRRLLNFTGVTPSGEMNETLRRQLRVIGADGRIPVTSTQWPYYKVVYLEFQTSSGRSRCTGVLITVRHVLTSGHCISDGNGRFYWDWKVYPNHRAGYSREFTASYAWVFNGWHLYSDFNWDLGILTLATTNTGFGYFGFGWNTGITSSWNFGVVGYPADKGDIMQRQNMFMDYSIDYNLLKTKTGDVVGGNSGGPAYFDSNKVIYGITSHETYNRYTGIGISNGFTRITKEKFDAMCSYISIFPETSYYVNFIR